MFSIIVEAAENFCLHQIRLPYGVEESGSKKRTLLAYIDIDTPQGETHRVYIGCDETLLQKITEVFLGEEDSDEQTLIDMLLETTNMIVGSSKVLAAEAYRTIFTIATPFFAEGETSMQMDDVKYIRVDGGEMTIGLQRL
jgi:hypothetical protein